MPVVEDNPEVCKLTLRRLALLGYRVGEAENGPAILRALYAIWPDQGQCRREVLTIETA